MSGATTPRIFGTPLAAQFLETLGLASPSTSTLHQVPDRQQKTIGCPCTLSHEHVRVGTDRASANTSTDESSGAMYGRDAVPASPVLAGIGGIEELGDDTWWGFRSPHQTTPRYT